MDKEKEEMIRRLTNKIMLDCDRHTLLNENVKAALEEIANWAYVEGGNDEMAARLELELAIFGNEKASKPLGVSRWKEHGIKYGYWGYFKKEAEKYYERELEVADNRWKANEHLVHENGDLVVENALLQEEIEQLKEKLK